MLCSPQLFTILSCRCIMFVRLQKNAALTSLAFAACYVQKNTVLTSAFASFAAVWARLGIRMGLYEAVLDGMGLYGIVWGLTNGMGPCEPNGAVWCRMGRPCGAVRGRVGPCGAVWGRMGQYGARAAQEYIGPYGVNEGAEPKSPVDLSYLYIYIYYIYIYIYISFFFVCLFCCCCLMFCFVFLGIGSLEHPKSAHTKHCRYL